MLQARNENLKLVGKAMGDNAQPLVRAVDMGKRYGEFVALHPLNVEVHSGEFFGVFGPNGAGKSTFIKLLTGQLQPSIGQIEVLGVDARQSPQKLKAMAMTHFQAAIKPVTRKAVFMTKPLPLLRVKAKPQHHLFSVICGSAITGRRPSLKKWKRMAL